MSYYLLSRPAEEDLSTLHHHKVKTVEWNMAEGLD